MKHINILYEGDLRSRTLNGDLGAIIIDAPKQFGGKEEAISPTELVVSALGSCMFVMMGIAAKNNGIDIKGARIDASEEMAVTPKLKISKMFLSFRMNPGIPSAKRKILEQAVYACPVQNSLLADIEYKINFTYTD